MIISLLKKSLTKLKTKMSTSACITVLGTDGIYRSVYNHSDGYPDWLLISLEHILIVRSWLTGL